MSLTLFRRLASVGAPLVVLGCAAQTVGRAPDRPRGDMAARAGRAGYVVAAPHGSSDARTAEIAAIVARRTGFGLVVATGFSLDTDRPGQPGRRLHVNRPFEGVAGRPPAEDVPTAEARQVYERWERLVLETAQGPLRFYVEIHGNGRGEIARRIEIATVGVSHEFAQRLRALAELIRDAHLRGRAGVPRLEMLVEPADPIVYAATGAKRDGILRWPARALHIELPMAARVDFAEVYTLILADFVTQVASLPEGR